MDRKRLDKCLEAHLSKITISQELHESLQGIPKGRASRVSGFHPALLLAVFLCLLSASAIAAAWTLYQSAKEPADQLASILSHDQWSLEGKEQLIDMMVYIGYDLDAQVLQAVKNPTLEKAEREKAAEAIIAQTYGEQMRRKADASILQQTETVKPDMETVFRDLCLHINPEASEEEIEAAYQSWLLEYYSVDQQSIPKADHCKRDIISEAEAQEKARAYLYDVLNFSQTEIDHTSISVSREEKGWRAAFAADPGTLRDALKKEWAFSPAASGLWQWSVLLADNGDFVAEDEYYAYCLDHLIPASAYPGYSVYEDKTRAFLYASVEEQAAFSEKWKPIVDDYIKSHPGFEAYFSSAPDFCTEYVITRHAYGRPTDESIPEAKALAIAKKAYLQAGIHGVTAEMIEERCACFTLFDVTDASAPVWKVSIAFDTYGEASRRPEEHKDGYFVVMDAASGAVIRQYIQTGPEGKSRECHNADLFAEWFR